MNGSGKKAGIDQFEVESAIGGSSTATVMPVAVLVGVASVMVIAVVIKRRSSLRVDNSVDVGEWDSAI
jgi:uncharacterized membrane protein YuzA (DUF378 family)